MNRDHRPELAVTILLAIIFACLGLAVVLSGAAHGSSCIQQAHLTAEEGRLVAHGVVQEGCELRIGLASYQNTTPRFDPDATQTLIAFAFNYPHGGPFSFSLPKPTVACWQVDLFTGNLLHQIDSDHHYGDRLLDHMNRGTEPCAPPSSTTSTTQAVTTSSKPSTATTAPPVRGSAGPAPSVAVPDQLAMTGDWTDVLLVLAAWLLVTGWLIFGLPKFLAWAVRGKREL